MIELALVTGISPQAWGDAGARAISTALELLEERNNPAPDASDGVQYSG